MKNNEYKVETMQLYFKKLRDKQNYIYIFVHIRCIFPSRVVTIIAFPYFN
jgi:hypothetical protein